MGEALRAALAARAVPLGEHCGYSFDCTENPVGVFVAVASWCVREGARANHWHAARAVAATREDAERALLAHILSTPAGTPNHHPLPRWGADFFASGVPCAG